jgi:hypothetical protein
VLRRLEPETPAPPPPRPAVEEPPEAPAGEEFVLSSTLVSGEGRSARLGPRTVREGDVVAGFRVVRIADGVVVLKGRKSQHTLTIRRKP